jgi:hypothetical protein
LGTGRADQLLPSQCSASGTCGMVAVVNCQPTAVQLAAGTAGPHRHAGRRRGARNLAAHRLNSNQIEFVYLIIGSLAEHGVVDAARIYESRSQTSHHWVPKARSMKAK